MNIKNIKIQKRDITFAIIGLLLLIGLIGFVVYSLRFLVIKADVALENDDSGEDKLPRINFDGLKKIGIMK